MEHDCLVDTITEWQWLDRLIELLRAASLDESASLALDDLPIGINGFTKPAANFGRPDYPFVTVRRSLIAVGQESTVLHESAHWRLRHVMSGRP
jgi:hypothetical protein